MLSYLEAAVSLLAQIYQRQSFVQKNLKHADVVPTMVECVDAATDELFVVMGG